MGYFHTTTTETQLTRRNFVVAETRLMASTTGFYLFGLIPLKTPNHATAMQRLRSLADLKGESRALVNLTQTRSMVFLFLFSIPKVTVTADVVEFQD